MKLHQVQQRGTEIDRVVAPTSLDDVVRTLGELAGAAKVVAGGSDLVLDLHRGAHPDTHILIDLSRVQDLDRLTTDDDGMHLGPLVTHNQVVADPSVRRQALPLAQACLEVGSPQLRNRATVVGNLVTASPANDTLSALLALDARLELRSVRGTRTLQLDDFVTGFRTTALSPDELVTKVTIPPPAGVRRGIYVKLGLRRAQAISVVHLAVVLEFAGPAPGEPVASARLAVGSVAPTVLMVDTAAATLQGRPLTDESIAAAAGAAAAAASPIDDLRGTAAYRSDTIAVMVRRALRALADGREATAWPASTPLLAPRPRGYRPMARPADLHVDAPIDVRVNGQNVRAPGAANATLLDWLRNDAHHGGTMSLTGTKEGCAEGECGACTVLLDGAAVMSCLVPAAQADGREVTTVEGLADPESLHPIQEAFVDHGAVQCGFCIPGFLVAGAALIDEVADPDETAVGLGLAGNLCRCTGYYKIIDAVRSAAATRRKGER